MSRRITTGYERVNDFGAARFRWPVLDIGAGRLAKLASETINYRTIVRMRRLVL